MKKFIIIRTQVSDSTTNIKTEYLHNKEEGYERYKELDTNVIILTFEELIEIYNYVTTIDDIDSEIEIESSHN